MKVIQFNIFNRNMDGIGKTFLTSVEFPVTFTAKEVKERLIHSGSFPADIIVRKYC